MSETGPLFVSSGDLVADRRYKWALDQVTQGDLAAAAEILQQTVEFAPAFATAWFALGAVRDRLSDTAGAIAAFERTGKLDPQDYHGARLQLARLGAGEAAPALTPTYVRRLFDQYAGRFDSVLVAHLDYRGPALLVDAVAAVRNAAHRPMHFACMLDLGCGAGLAGAAFRACVDRLVGVDLSPAMIAQAEAKGFYDRLVTAELAAALVREKAEAARSDLVVAADVLVYVHDPRPIVAAIVPVLMAAGLFAFTVETHAGEGIKLLPTLRYAHAEADMRGILHDAGMEVAYLAKDAVRREKGVPVESLVLVAGRRPVPAR